jgi:hypothetical protein
MSRMLQGSVLALLVVAAGSGSARADWWGYPTYTSGYYYVSYYYPVVTPVYYVVQPVTCVAPPPVMVPPVARGPYAQPQAAPPSSPQSNEPPLLKKTSAGPKVSESQSFSLDAKAVPVAMDGGGSCRVGFWNVSGRDVKLTVGGKAYMVPRDRNLTLTVGREFTWGIDTQTEQTERVPQEQSSHEIVIR